MPFTASFVHSLYIVALFARVRKYQSVTVKMRGLFRLFAQIRLFLPSMGIYRIQRKNAASGRTTRNSAILAPLPVLLFSCSGVIIKPC